MRAKGADVAAGGVLASLDLCAGCCRACRSRRNEARMEGIAASAWSPGFITGVVDDDPNGIATCTQAGAQFGAAMLWVPLLTFPLIAAVLEISARIGRVSGHGLAGNIRATIGPA